MRHAYASSHLHSFSASPRGSALTTERASWSSPCLCSLVMFLFLSQGASHTRPLPQAYAGRRPAVMGTSPVLNGNIFPSNSGSADTGTIPKLDGNIFPGNS